MISQGIEPIPGQHVTVTACSELAATVMLPTSEWDSVVVPEPVTKGQPQ